MSADTKIGNRIVDPSRWDEIGPLLDGGILRPYEELRHMPYYAPPGFYADEGVLAFQPGWDGQEGQDAVHWYGPDWPTVDQVREKIASLLISSWLVQDRGDAGRFFLGDEPGSLETPWGVIPAHVVFAWRKGNDMPWENLDAILRHVDAGRGIEGAAMKAFVEWRLRTPVPTQTRAVFYARNDGGLQVVLYPRHPLRPAADNISFSWGPGGSPLGGEREEYEIGAVGLYDAIPVAATEDALTRAVMIYA
jgi:hypothetical protein|nr:MAG TPA: hypothetical protein [Caudoviricetes sp.]